MPAVNVRRRGMGSTERSAKRKDTQVNNLCYGGSTEAGQIRVDPPCICRAEQDWQDARSERPATGHGQP